MHRPENNTEPYSRAIVYCNRMLPRQPETTGSIIAVYGLRKKPTSLPEVDPNHWTVFYRFLASEIPLILSLVSVTQALFSPRDPHLAVCMQAPGSIIAIHHKYLARLLGFRLLSVIHQHHHLPCSLNGLAVLAHGISWRLVSPRHFPACTRLAGSRKPHQGPAGTIET